MSIARMHLISRIQAIQAVLDDRISVDTVPVPSLSSSAVVIRNGCFVMLFCALEDFVRARAVECAQRLNQAAVPYTHLPEALKTATLVSTFEGLLNVTRGWQESDKLNEFEAAAKLVSAGPLGSPYQFSQFSFGREKSNLGSEDIAGIARRFGVKSFWNQARDLKTRFGGGAPQELSIAFKALAKTRHKAAHVPSHKVDHAELGTALWTAVDVAIGFDMLISVAVSRLNIAQLPAGGVAEDVTCADVSYVFLRPHKNKWAVFSASATTTRAQFVEPEFAAAQSRASAHATRHGIAVVVQDASRRVTGWQTAIG